MKRNKMENGRKKVHEREEKNSKKKQERKKKKGKVNVYNSSFNNKVYHKDITKKP